MYSVVQTSYYPFDSNFVVFLKAPSLLNKAAMIEVPSIQYSDCQNCESNSLSGIEPT